MMTREPDGRIYALHPPADKDWYELDWSLELEVGETIATSAWAADPLDAAPITLTEATYSGPVTGVFAAGGVLGQNHLVINRITTSQGRSISRTVVLRCRYL
jgi:hypothetical protein